MEIHTEDILGLEDKDAELKEERPEVVIPYCRFDPFPDDLILRQTLKAALYALVKVTYRMD